MSPAARRILLSVVAILAVVLLVGVWIIRGPGPMAFGTARMWTLADYKAANPTGVPAKLAKASLVERGAYLARAADCMVCHTTQGGKEYAGGLASGCRSARCIRPTSRPTRKPASAITAIRIFSMRSIAEHAAMARGFIRRCRIRPIPT